jgi:hypothetical protein
MIIVTITDFLSIVSFVSYKANIKQFIILVASDKDTKGRTILVLKAISMTIIERNKSKISLKPSYKSSILRLEK